MIKFNLITMKDGEINVEEKKDLSKMLTDNMEELREKHVNKVFEERLSKSITNNTAFEKESKKVAMDLPKGFYLNNQNSEFFTSNLETMVHTITDEAKKWKIEKRLKEGNSFGTFRRYKTKQPMLVKAYKTRKGADNGTFWRNH